MPAASTMQRRTVARSRKAEHPLPGRPAACDLVAGPDPDPADRRRAARSVRAVCCSGGGIRAAAFTLGGLQALNAASDPADPTSSWYGRADLLTAVSGGSYIAASYALIEQGRKDNAPDHVSNHAPDAVLDDAGPVTYAPGSPEDQRLRAHTRYLIDSKTQLSISLLGLVYGLAMNLAAVLAAAYILAKLLGLVLGRHVLDLLRLSAGRRTWSTVYPSALVWTIVGVACLGGLIYLGYRLVDTYSRVGQLAATRTCVLVLWLLAGAAVAAVLLLGVPALLQLTSRPPGRISQVSLPRLTATIGGLGATVVPIVSGVVHGYGSAKGGAASRPGLGKRVADAVLPWLGSAIVVVLLAGAVLAWTWNAALDRSGAGQWWGVAGCAAGLLLWQTITDVNRTSLHRVYAQRLASAFGVRRDGLEPTEREQALSTFRRGPHLVVCATANTDQPGIVPTGRHCAPFTFSPSRSGISAGTMFRGTGHDPGDDDGWLARRERGDPARADWATSGPGLDMSTADLETCSNSLSLMDMVAISGAAVSPAMGRMTRPSLRLLLGMANVRLGMWLPNPTHPRWAQVRRRGSVGRVLLWQLRQPGLLSLWREIIGGITLNGAWIYVTDGGHYENLGLVEALRRGATEIVVLDASGDRPFSLSTFGEAVETARADLGVEIRLDRPDALAERGTTGTARALAAHAVATYANGVRADIYLCKAAMAADLPPDVLTWHLEHPAFPDDSTGQQLYGDREFEAYRRLGEAAAGQALTLMTSDGRVSDDAAWRPDREAAHRHTASL